MAIHPDLPELCFTLHRDTGVPIALKRGEPGYFQTDFPVQSAGGVYATEWVAKQNARLGVTTSQVAAMEFGSMFGWHLPGADPSMWPRKAVA